MKILGIGFLKTELNRTDLKIQKLKTLFPRFGFQKPTSAVWGRFFMWSYSQFILQHDRINSQSIFLHAVSLHFYTLLTSESFWLTISWINSAWKYVIFSVIHIKQHAVQKTKPKPRLI